MKHLRVVALASALCAGAWLAGAEEKVKLQQDSRADQPARSSVTTHKANEMIGATVQNKAGEKLGSIRDFAFEMPSGKLAWVIVASGGILGLGADYHAVPPKAFSHETATPRVLTLDLTKDRWESSPKFKKDQLSGLNAHREQIEKHFAESKDSDFKAQAKIGDAKAEVKIKTPDISGAARSNDDGSEPLRLASDVIGKQVVTQQNHDIGRVSDLLVDMKDAKVAFAIISTGSLLKPSETRYAVATQNLSLGSEKNKIVLNVDRDALEKAEVFDAERWQTGGKTSGTAGVFKYEQEGEAKAEIKVDADKSGASKTTAPGSAGLTALSLIDQGNRYVGEQARGKLVQLRSEKSTGGLTPTVWYVVYYDPTAALKATEVKFANGKMVDVKRPLRLLEATSDRSEPLDRARIKIDSDKALQTALDQPALQGVKPTASEMRLERGPASAPVWRIQLWAAKANDPADDVNLGIVSLSAEDGKVLDSDLKTDKANSNER